MSALTAKQWRRAGRPSREEVEQNLDCTDAQYLALRERADEAERIIYLRQRAYLDPEGAKEWADICDIPWDKVKPKAIATRTQAQEYDRVVQSIAFMAKYDEAGAAELSTAVGIPASTDDEIAEALRKWRERGEKKLTIVNLSAKRQDRKQPLPPHDPVTGEVIEPAAAAKVDSDIWTPADFKNVGGMDASRYGPNKTFEMRDGAWRRIRAPQKIRATPFVWIDPSKIPPRDWIYGKHYIRKFVGMTTAPGGSGKSSLVLVEAVAMAVSRDLLGVGYKPERKLRVWVWNGEDPIEETQRRLAAICLYYGIKREDIEGQLFLDSGRNTEIKIATKEQSGFKIAVPVAEQVTQTIIDNKIDVMIVDPFISSHSVEENDNTAIDAVVKKFGGIADKTDSAFELVHHMRKGAPGQRNHEIGDARGAGAGVDAVRSGRVVNVMDKETADKFGIDPDDMNLYFRVNAGKANMAKKTGKGDWYFLASVDLGNKTKTRDADEVGVVTRWKVPNPLDEVTGADARAIVERIGDVALHRENVQAKYWVGKVVAEVLGLDAADKDAKAKIKTMLTGWLKSGQLKVVEAADAHGELRRFIVAGNTRLRTSAP